MENYSKCSVVQSMLYLTKIRALASPLHVFCPYFMPFFTFSSVFHNLLDLFSNLTSFLNIIFIFPMNDTFFSFIQQFIQFFVAKYSFKKIFIFFREALFKFKISFIQKIAVLFIQKYYSFFWKDAYRTGLHDNLSYGKFSPHDNFSPPAPLVMLVKNIRYAFSVLKIATNTMIYFNLSFFKLVIWL